MTIATLETDMMVEIDNEKKLDTLFDAAKAAAADEGITLLRTAVTLTAVGDLSVRAALIIPLPSSLGNLPYLAGDGRERGGDALRG